MLTDRPKKRPKPKTPLVHLRRGEEVPWKYGAYRVVVQRRVTEEEQISIECYEATADAARAVFSAFMEAMRDHMIAHNEKVVMIHQDRLMKLERMIERRAEELRELEIRVEAAKNGTPIEDEDDDAPDAG